MEQAAKRWKGRELIDSLAAQHILIRCPSMRAVAEEALRRTRTSITSSTLRKLRDSPTNDLGP
jgi:hypothetical protein